MVKTTLFRRAASVLVLLIWLLLLFLPASPVAAAPAAGKPPTAWDVSFIANSGGSQLTGQATVVSSQSEDLGSDFSYMCEPGGDSGGIAGYVRNSKDDLKLNASGKLNGTCSGDGTYYDDTFTVSGFLNGQVDLKNGTVTFTGGSDFIDDGSASGSHPGHYERHLTYTGNGKYKPDAAGQPTDLDDGILTFSYHYLCGGCSTPTDHTYTGAFDFRMSFFASEPAPDIQLDRAEAAHFGAIKLSGSGFKPKITLKVMFGGEETFRFDTLPDGTVPDNTWIWVPDDLPAGHTQVWVEQVGGGDQTSPLDFNIVTISNDRLVKNLDAIIKQYLAAIPTNDRWYAKLRSGGINNIVNAGQTVVAGVVRYSNIFLPSILFNLSPYKNDLWPDNKFVCSWYQAEVLDFFDKLRFNPNPTQRALLDGFDYGPFNSGFSPVAAGSHFFVILWPHGAALEPAVANSLQPAWDTAGITFDPWIKQTPDLFEINTGSASWATASTYAARWQIGDQHTYYFPRIEPASWGYHPGEYPITGGIYYSPKGGNLALDYRKVTGIGIEPPKMVAVHSPVTLEFTDDQGHKAGMDAKGQLYSDIPTSEITTIPKPEGGFEWYVALPAGNIKLTVTGAGDGNYQLLTKSAGHPIQAYPQVAVKAGEVATLTLNDDEKPLPLHTAAGQDLSPTPQELPQALATVNSTQPSAPTTGAPGATGSSSSTLLLVGGVCCGGLLLVAVVVVIILLARRKKRQSAPQPPSAPQYPQAPQYPPAAPARRQPVMPSVGQPAYLWVYQQGAPNGGYWVTLPPDGLIIGRAADCGLVLNDPMVSRNHARLFFSEGRWNIADLTPAQGLWVNGQRVIRCALNSEDQIQVGQTVLRFRQ